MSKKHFGTK